jgi:hypothetical protein
MKPLRLWAIAAIATLQLFAADPAPSPQDAAAAVGQRGNSEANPEQTGTTGKLLNGRTWLALTRVEKNAWINGFMEAAYMWQGDIMLRLRKDGKDPFAAENHHDSIVFDLPRSLTFGEISESLDRLYAEPTNRIIPIIYAFPWVDLKAKGVSESGLKDWEARTRAIWSSDVGKK